MPTEGLFCKKPIGEKEARLLSPLSLAFVGDAVQTLYVRETLVQKGGAAAGGGLHKATAAVVNATRQSAVGRAVLPHLNEAESDVYRRGRNSKNGTAAKNAAVVDYRQATALEAVMGYLYLTGQAERLAWLLQQSMEG